ncbi:hypothetical protein DGG96_03535 [Legionella qingyii]|uniref:Uncharacterized protein n=1 Tax=Legionella qingyii TaxID=2184757 RepID=A0A317U9J9_9GAMM|nr:hypothetical protein DGG96_03535 [Legionella qingyii]
MVEVLRTVPILNVSVGHGVGVTIVSEELGSPTLRNIAICTVPQQLVQVQVNSEVIEPVISKDCTQKEFSFNPNKMVYNTMSSAFCFSMKHLDNISRGQDVRPTTITSDLTRSELGPLLISTKGPRMKLRTGSSIPFLKARALPPLLKIIPCHG